MRSLTVAATQMACSEDPAANLDRAEALVRDAAARGARLILLQELFETPYFCKDQDMGWFSRARPVTDNPVIARFAALAAELGVVLPLSFFERANSTYYNSLVMIDADGTVGATYRKSHIPQGPGYEEKFYFSPGDTGFRVWDTAVGRIGAAICWDQWFPEAARACALMGAEVMLYPTAIGSEPTAPDLDTLPHWRRAMQGHAASNILPVVASNRIGAEAGPTCSVTFYGGSFITDHTGALLAEADRVSETVLTATLDLEAIAPFRAGWGLLRDRRPELYGPLLTLDGRTRAPG
ncbi:N-carbamoylputrescine amidase [Roseospira marina]|uniref:N-carbamoylputrescine amidase n=1 Tax=Roseospira marina TaxID=140057 RepID=A0A5M6IH74_9PROT|nr:N-carbamoylputrescine amidase [Roseospira marina]KAA5607661.1 N-carbamoylputrescine amidase [Roseospira marina]MBB4312136.1 N-carbamoylputrescine amidase [Roseospira marina]MBB5085848.1 N-carbamoylputrescine amidase [Roseospira marina]